MAILYVNKSGSDSNNGSTPTLAKLTIQGAVTASANNDTIIVGAGLYNEKISSASKNLTLSADGTVVCDGTGIASNPAISFTGGTGLAGMTVKANDNVGLWIFQNHVATNLISNTNSNLIISDSLLFSNSNATGLNNAYHIVATRCVLSGFTDDIKVTSPFSATAYNCTFYNGTTGISGGSSSTYIISLCIFSNLTTAWYSPNISGLTYLNDNLYYNITNWKIGSNTYTTLAQVQALNPNYDSRSIVADPYFTDASKNIFYPTQALPILNVGAFPYSLTQGSNNDSLGKWNIIAGAGHDNSGFYNPDGNVVKDGTSGDFILNAGTTGVIWSPVFDLGASYPITRFNLSAILTWPTNMVDTTITDVRPNYQTIEIRARASSYNQDDATADWTEVKSNMNFTAISGRYCQFRLTLRNNDIAS